MDNHVGYKKPKVRIHFGASKNEISIDGHKFDRDSLKKWELEKISNMTQGALKNAGYFERKVI